MYTVGSIAHINSTPASHHTPQYMNCIQHEDFKRVQVRGLSCEPNNQLNVCTTSETEGEVGAVKHVKAP